MLRATDIVAANPLEPIYTFVEKTTGKNVNIASERLRQWTLTQDLEQVLVPVNAPLAQTFVRDNIVSRQRLVELMTRNAMGEEFAPILFAKDGGSTNGAPDVMLIDGHHRLVIAAALGRPFILSQVLEECHWRPFEIAGLPDITDEELKAIPILARSY